MKNFTSYLKKAFGITLVLIVLCGVVYPLVMTGAGQLLFEKTGKWKYDRNKRKESRFRIDWTGV